MVSPQWKLRLQFDGGWTLQDKLHFTSHAQRKDFAIQLVDRWCKTQNPQQTIARQFFEKHKGKTKKLSKQDDLADSLLQAIAWHLLQLQKPVKRSKRKKITEIIEIT